MHATEDAETSAQARTRMVAARWSRAVRGSVSLLLLPLGRLDLDGADVLRPAVYRERAVLRDMV